MLGGDVHLCSMVAIGGSESKSGNVLLLGLALEFLMIRYLEDDLVVFGCVQQFLIDVVKGVFGEVRGSETLHF